jgi:hypothetical protein
VLVLFAVHFHGFFSLHFFCNIEANIFSFRLQTTIEKQSKLGHKNHRSQLPACFSRSVSKGHPYLFLCFFIPIRLHMHATSNLMFFLFLHFFYPMFQKGPKHPNLGLIGSMERGDHVVVCCPWSNRQARWNWVG